jgi:DUF4097 and DUF4098 domain-containing protein YvlB
MHRRIAYILAIVSLLFAATAALAEEDGRFERTLKVSGMSQVEVSTGSGNISVHTGDASAVRVIGHIHANHSWLFGGRDMDKVKRIEANPPIEQTGNIIKIGRINDPEARRNISIDFEVWVPEQTTLNANSGSGDVMVENLKSMVTARTGSGNVQLRQIKGDVHANTGSGDVTMDGVAGNVNADTGSGNIKIGMAAAGSLRLGTGSGDVIASGVKGGFRAHTGSGNITADGDVTSEWAAETGSGDVNITLPQSARFELLASTGSGDLNINREITMSGTLDKHRIRGKVNGGGPLVQLQTSSGNIRLK